MKKEKIMLVIDLDNTIELELNELAEQYNKSVPQFIKDLILEYLEDLHGAALGDAVMDDIVNGKEPVYSSVILDALALYEEQQEDNECLAIIAQRQNEKTISYEDVLAGLKADGII